MTALRYVFTTVVGLAMDLTVFMIVLGGLWLIHSALLHRGLVSIDAFEFLTLVLLWRLLPRWQETERTTND